MNSKKKLLEKINPKLLELTPKSSFEADSVITIEIGENVVNNEAQKLMQRFYKRQELILKNKSHEDNIEFTTSKELCQSLSEKLFSSVKKKNEINCNGKVKKLPDFKHILKDEIAIKRKENYIKRLIEHNKWKNEQKSLCNESTECESEDELIYKKDIVENYVNSNDDESYQNSECEKLDSAYNPLDHDTVTLNNLNSESTEIHFEETKSSEKKNSSLKVSALDNENYNDHAKNISETSFRTESFQFNKEVNMPIIKDTETNDNSLSQYFKSSFLNLSCSKILDRDKLQSSQLDKKLEFSNEKEFDLADAYEFCSGKFPEIKDLSQLDINEEVSNKSTLNENASENISENKNLKKNTKSRIFFEDDENSDSENDEELDDSHIDNDNNDDDDAVEDSENNRPKPHKILSAEEYDSRESISGNNRKIKGALMFSDEEDEEDNVVNNPLQSDDTQNSEFDENDGSEILDYDQNSIVDSEDNYLLNMKNFFEKEAEVSGSEGSEDEDEKDLDKFEEEEGDKDDLDYAQVQSQLEKIHLRRLLDDDSKNIRLLQELFFEDGDLHTDEKYKKFRWKNNGDDNSENIKIDESLTKDDEGDCSDDEIIEDMSIRRERLMNQLLFEKKTTEELFSNDLFKNTFQKLKVTSVKSQIKPFFNDEEKKKNISSINSFTFNSRGSFLSENKEVLSKLAKVSTFAVTDNSKNTNSKNSKNFVFASKTPEKEKPEKQERKRRPEEEEDDKKSKKKLKFRRDTSNPIPSLLDLVK